MNKNNYIFDWSGTLSNNFHLFCNVCDLIFTELGHETISQTEIRQNITMPYMRFWNKYFPKMTKEEQSKLYIKHIHSVGDPDIYDNVEETITHLHQAGHKIFIISSDPPSKLLPEIEKARLNHLLTHVTGGVHEKHPHISYYVKNYSLDKNRTYYIGDTSGDVEAGKLAGIKTIGITWGFQHKDVLSSSKPDYLIDDIAEIQMI